jgi:hypothetical protein
MPKKGVSKSDKLKRTIEYLYEKREPFMLKDLERDLPKAKGIIAQVCGCVFIAPCLLSLPVCPSIQHVFVCLFKVYPFIAVYAYVHRWYYLW